MQDEIWPAIPVSKIGLSCILNFFDSGMRAFVLSYNLRTLKDLTNLLGFFSKGRTNLILMLYPEYFCFFSLLNIRNSSSTNSLFTTSSASRFRSHLFAHKLSAYFF